jgi:hypothetical protein
MNYKYALCTLSLVVSTSMFGAALAKRCIPLRLSTLVPPHEWALHAHTECLVSCKALAQGYNVDDPKTLADKLAEIDMRACLLRCLMDKKATATATTQSAPQASER